MNEPSIHHLLPQSRNGTNKKWNLITIPQNIHSAWHNLFANLLPEEVCLLIPFIGLETEKRKESWQTLFGEKSRLDAIKIVRRKWSPKKRKRRE